MRSRDADQVIISIEPCMLHSVRTPHARHRHFPEIRAEGDTPEAAAQNLHQKMTCALDAKGPDDWHRVELEHAIEDVRAYLEGLGLGEQVGRPD